MQNFVNQQNATALKISNILPQMAIYIYGVGHKKIACLWQETHKCFHMASTHIYIC